MFIRCTDIHVPLSDIVQPIRWTNAECLIKLTFVLGYLFLETMKHDKYVVISWKIGMTE